MAHQLMESLSLTAYSPLSDNSKTTLWMGDLEPWMDENYIRQLWSSLGENVVAKLIRDKRSGISAGYAFIGFSSTLSAQRALATVHGTRIPNTQRTFRLNWASGGGIHDRKEDRAPEYSLFVGDLSSEIDETYLLALFRQRYLSCHSAKVMTDPLSGLSRGYGFVRFHDYAEHQDALVEMNGVYCGTRPMRVSLATPKNSNARYHQLALQAPALVQQPTDPSNTTVFVGGLSSPVSEEELRRCFSPYGDIVYVKIPPNKGCGFVQYVSRQSAELAIEQMNGYQIGSSRIRLSWGRSQNDKPITSSATATTTTATAAAPVAMPHTSPTFDHLWTSPASFLPQTHVPAAPDPVATTSATASAAALRYQMMTGNVFGEPTSTSLPLSPPQSATFRSFSPPPQPPFLGSRLRRPQPLSPSFSNDFAMDPVRLVQPQLDMAFPTNITLANQDQSSSSWRLSDNARDHDANWRLSGIYAQ